MKFLQLLLLAPVASSFVITDTEVFQKLEKSGKELFEHSQNVVDDAFEKAKHLAETTKSKVHETAFDVESWLEDSHCTGDGADEVDFWEDHPHRPPHHRKPHHPPHHGKPNLTVYELINKSKYTTKLAKLINEDEDLVKTLNGTAANYTVFAPTDAAFEKIPKHGKRPSKEFLKNLLLYHVSSDFYPAGRVLHSYTIPTLYEPEDLGHAQRLTVRVTLRGPAINFYSKIVAVNIFGTNGVIHGIDSILVPPPRVVDIIDILPGEFSTLELALAKTGLLEKFNSTDYPHEGGTFFAPSNFAFKKLGPKINAFLFSKFGQKYLKALLKYHIVVNQTLYSDAFYNADKDEQTKNRPPYYHFDLPTVLGRNLAVDVARYGPFISIRINGFSRVTVHDGVAKDGVIQVVGDVLIPPKTGDKEAVYWEGEELSVEEFQERLDPLLDNEGQENMDL